jgi:hypothetical protein
MLRISTIVLSLLFSTLLPLVPAYAVTSKNCPVFCRGQAKEAMQKCEREKSDNEDLVCGGVPDGSYRHCMDHCWTK